MTSSGPRRTRTTLNPPLARRATLRSKYTVEGFEVVAESLHAPAFGNQASIRREDPLARRTKRSHVAFDRLKDRPLLSTRGRARLDPLVLPG